MSKFKVLSNINDNLDKVIPDEICFFIDEKTTITEENMDRMAAEFKDPKIGFVYTDAVIKTEEYSFVEYLSGKDLPDIAFAMRVPEGITLEKVNGESKSLLMRQLAAYGLYFIHIADPLIEINE